MRALFHDDAGAEEADARDDIGRDLRRAEASVEVHAERDEGGGPDGDQHIGPQSRAALTPLPLRADQGRQHERDDEADGQVQQMPQVEICYRRHASPLIASAALVTIAAGAGNIRHTERFATVLVFAGLPRSDLYHGSSVAGAA